jgi:hypothetical protein
LCFLIPRKTLRLAGQEHGRAIPLADICTAAKKAPLFDHFVGASEQRMRRPTYDVCDAGTLVQGKWNVGEQFVYATAHAPSGKQSLFVARFREAFAVAGLVYDDLKPPEVEGFSVVRPGFLRSNW